MGRKVCFAASACAIVVAACVFLNLAGRSAQADESKGDKAAPKVFEILIANDTGEEIFFFVNGKHGSTPMIRLKKSGIASITFYDDGNERSLAAFDKAGKKVLSRFTFTPGNFCLLIEKNQKDAKTEAAGSRKPTYQYSGGEGPKPI